MQEYIVRPFFQAAFFALLTMVMIPIVRPKTADSVFGIAGVIYAVFILVNSILIVLASKVWPYFFYSMFFSLVYVIFTGLLMTGYVEMTKKGSGESAMVFIAIMYHPFTLLLGIFLKWAYSKVF